MRYECLNRSRICLGYYSVVEVIRNEHISVCREDYKYYVGSYLGILLSLRRLRLCCILTGVITYYIQLIHFSSDHIRASTSVIFSHLRSPLQVYSVTQELHTDVSQGALTSSSFVSVLLRSLIGLAE